MVFVRWILLGFFLACGVVSEASTPSPSSDGLLLRVRMMDGSMQRIQVPPGAEGTMSLKEALSGLLLESSDKPLIKIGTSSSEPVQDDTQTIAALNLKRGSLINLVSSAPPKTAVKKTSASKPKTAASDRWNPFPDLAKDYEAALRKAKVYRSTKTGMSYSDIAKLQAALHNVDPQEVGPITRIYMCAKSAERFHNNGKKKSGEVECRIGLVFGTIQRERVDLKPKARTSLSSQTESSQYCSAARVHALWEPSAQKPTAKLYDTTSIPSSFSDATNTMSDLPRVLRVAKWLGLKPIGWIFAYNDNRHKDQDALPVYAQDAKTGALLQIANMKHLGREEGCKFVTLSMQASTGATEAFQLSDVCVQMVAEDLWDLSADDTKKQASRFVKTKHDVIVDARETKELDSVLCLVNTAMLSQNGLFSGPAVNTVKKSGGVTNKVKKTILASLDESDSNKLLETLCDLNLLVTLDKNLAPAEMEQLCTLVRKWARGQKRGTQIEDRLKNLLRSLLNQ
ncbi:expressed unknown protein [Seminavis robusta]|uniref:Ubiquitin-like domain-containing protein n=1 Tax=Seminavis robusta TaxID=568900 RepID=A0A9N8E822_9STRA|nr:expressed unknown protein [Seminavis robusta]|eukprot:Sro756_g197770.1 n/a (511) ;mRNA; r:24385-25917